MAKRKTTEEYREEVYQLVDDKYEVLGEYKNNKTHIKTRHISCGYVYDVTPNMFLRGTRCPSCSGLIKKTTKEFKEKVKELWGNEYSVNDEYINSRTKIKITHTICGRTFKTSSNNFISKNSGCPYCAGNIQKDTNQFKSELHGIVGDEYTVLSEHRNVHSKILVKHNICEHEYFVEPNKILNFNRRCPNCNNSLGELKIRDYLIEHEIPYEKEFIFDDCRNVRPLPFDFAIFDDNDRLVCLIEYDGIQHFKQSFPVNERSSLKYIQHHDGIKNDYCDKNDIKLIRIPYTEFENVEAILHNHLKPMSILSQA